MLGPYRVFPPSRRVWLLGAALVLYCVVMLQLTGYSHTCPDLDELVRRQLEAEPDSQLHLYKPRDDHPYDVINTRQEKPVRAPEVRAPVVSGAAHAQLLDQRLAPSTLHLVWCGRRWFEFHHYVNVLAMLEQLRPDLVIFHYDAMPIVDDWIYNTWFDDLRRDFPFLRLSPAAVKDKPCDAVARPRLGFIYDKLTFHGGVYVNEHTYIVGFPLHLRRHSVVDALNKTTRHGFLLAQRGALVSTDTLDPKHSTVKVTAMRCLGKLTSVTSLPRTAVCATNGDLFYPKDIWTGNALWQRSFRKTFYGSPEVPVVRQSSDELIPNIAHIVWIGGGQMDFLFYLCVLSLVYVAKVDVVYIHGDLPPTGHFWDQINREPKVKLIFRETPRTVYGTEVNVLSHVTDIWRVDFMIKYGGIYVDTDTAFVRPLDRNIRSYEAVGSYDWTYWNHPFPDTINFGVAIGKRNATYWQQFQKSMRWFLDKDWSWNGLRQPYRIKERHPELIRIDPHLQVICFEYKCHPTWHPQYHNESVHHQNSGSITDWRTQAYAFHWTLPTPPELLTLENLLSSNTMFSEIGKFILKQAGKL